jgi:heme/copper-type cytochrome/quinol oxidase subunit 3
LIVAFVSYRTRSPSGPGPESLDVPRMALFSVALFASSATLAFADRRLARDDYRGFRLGVLATIALGLVFLAGEATEWGHLIGEGVTIDRNLFTSAFYTLTGFHGLHVTAGVIALGVLALLTLDLRPGRRVAADAVSAYWHFVDALWVIIFSLVYLWALL